jgi:hypothetical protein
MLNALAGFQLFTESSLKLSGEESVAGAIGWREESRVGGDHYYRKYSLGEPSPLGGAVYSRSAKFSNGAFCELSAVFSNKGDSPSQKSSGSDLNTAIRKEYRDLEKGLDSIFGRSTSHVDRSGGVSESGRRWEWQGWTIFLSSQPEVYTRLAIFESSGKGGKISDADLRIKNQQSLTKRENGDVVISGIPMIDQGPKGYCVPASWARVLQYMGVGADMYVLGAASNSGAGGTDIFQASQRGVEVARAGGRKVSFPVMQPTVREVSSFIDRGIPVVWIMSYSDEFESEGRPKSGDQRQNISQGGAGRGGNPHACIIVGYNSKSKELAVSDSWGAGFEERWYNEKTARKASLGKFYAVDY